jgi:spermidine synthase
MAVIWHKDTKDTRYEVRTAGKTMRLYTNGVFHSHYNPNHIVTRNVWDLLVLPALIYPKGAIKRVLVLGVGGGAAIHLLNHFIQPEAIVGVELNPVHLNVAKRFFKVDYKNTQLVRGDAVEWVKNYKGKPFDMIIDDLYGEQDGEPQRAIAANRAWFTALNKLLSTDGMLVANFVTAKEFRSCAYFTSPDIKRRFRCAYKLTTRLYHNHIGAFLKSPQSIKSLKLNMQQHRATTVSEFSKSFKITRVAS